MTPVAFFPLAGTTLLAFPHSGLASEGPLQTLGYDPDTWILGPGGDGGICPGTNFLQQDDGSMENAYTWTFGGVSSPDYGAWAECYDSDFVCGIQILLTRTGYYIGQTMDVYVWESDADGNPPPGPDPGNVLCVLAGVHPGEIAHWPEISTHNFQVCCVVFGSPLRRLLA